MTETAHTPLPYECFQDRSYYDMWCVRRVNEREWGKGFHLVNGEEAAALRDMLNTRAVNSHHDLIEALRVADVDLVGAEMLLQNKSINATGALADANWQPGREHIEGMQRTINQALAEIASARAILTKAEAGHG